MSDLIVPEITRMRDIVRGLPAQRALLVLRQKTIRRLFQGTMLFLAFRRLCTSAAEAEELDGDGGGLLGGTRLRHCRLLGSGTRGVGGFGQTANVGRLDLRHTNDEDQERRFSERYFGRFERRIPVDDVDQDKVAASFKDGILTVTLPKSPAEQRR